MSRLLAVLILVQVAFISGCATLPNSDSPTVRVVGLDPLPSEGLEVRFALKLRVENPNETSLAYDGLSVKLDLDGRGLASGVSNSAGEIPRFSDTVLTVPVSISALGVVRQLWAIAGDRQGGGDLLNKPIEYKLNGKLGAAEGSLRATRFSDSGSLDLFAAEEAAQ